jgi:hypothetical protein
VAQWGGRPRPRTGALARPPAAGRQDDRRRHRSGFRQSKSSFRFSGLIYCYLSVAQNRCHPGIRPSKRRVQTDEFEPTSKVHLRVAHPEAERNRRVAAGQGRTRHPPGRRRAQEQNAHRRHRELLVPAPDRRRQIHPGGRHPFAQESDHPLHRGALRPHGGAGECHRVQRRQAVHYGAAARHPRSQGGSRLTRRRIGSAIPRWSRSRVACPYR